MCYYFSIRLKRLVIMMNKENKIKYLKSIIKLVLLCGCIGIISILSINHMVVSIGEKYTYNVETVPQADVIVVLGAMVYSNGMVSPILADRLDYAIELYNNKKAPKILLSGDHGTKSYDEVNAMKTYVCKSGIPEEDVFMDHAGFNTYNSMYRVRDIFQAEDIIVVTQDYHVKRAVFIARKLGIKAFGVASDKHIYPKMSIYESREVLARIKDFGLVSIFRPEPKYLGDTIDLQGDGRVTQD